MFIVKSSTLFILNLLASVFYLGTQNYFSEMISGIILILVVVLIFFTADRITKLNDGNPYLMSRLIILLSIALLLSSSRMVDVNAFSAEILFFVLILGTEAYEFFIKNHK